MDDILIHGRNQIEHDVRLQAVLLRLQEARLALNVQKCEFSQGRMRFLGHIVDAQGVHADPEKTRAIAQFPAPSTATELQRFFGMVNQHGKFIPRLADLNEPLRQLLRKQPFSGLKRSLYQPKSLHAMTLVFKHLLQRVPHQLGLEQFSFRLKTMDSAVLSATSKDPLVMLKRTMRSSRKKLLPQSGHMNALKNMCSDSASL